MKAGVGGGGGGIQLSKRAVSEMRSNRKKKMCCRSSEQQMQRLTQISKSPDDSTGVLAGWSCVFLCSGRHRSVSGSHTSPARPLGLMEKNGSRNQNMVSAAGWPRWRDGKDAFVSARLKQRGDQNNTLFPPL